jgi:aldose 1-epimerase
MSPPPDRPDRAERLVPSAWVRAWRGAAGLTLAADELEATFLPDLGLLGASLRHRGEELLALPGGLGGYRQGNVTGLPLLAPWANRLAGRRYRIEGTTVDLDGLALSTDANGLPIHGTMTARAGWSISRVEAGPEEAGMRASFDYGAWPELLAAFPFPHELTVEIRVATAVLTVVTILRATGDRAVPVSFGWHPYLRVPGAPRRTWRLRLPEREHLLLDRLGLPTGTAKVEPAVQQPIGQRTFDDLYALGDDRRLSLEAAGRRVVVDLEEGYTHAQVFAPPGTGFACLEPMTAPVNALGTGACRLVSPGETFSARFSIAVELAG